MRTVFGTVDDGMRDVIDEMIALLYAGLVTNGIIISQKPCTDHTRQLLPVPTTSQSISSQLLAVQWQM